jgi:hypothetical protein
MAVSTSQYPSRDSETIQLALDTFATFDFTGNLIAFDGDLKLMYLKDTTSMTSSERVRCHIWKMNWRRHDYELP